MARSSRPGVLAYVQKNPLYTLEHLALVCIASLYFFSCHLAFSSRSERLLADGGSLPKRPVQRGQCEEGDTYCCCPAGGSGPISIFNQKTVTKAPSQSLNMDQVEIGKAMSHYDNRGDIHKFKLGKDVTINLMRTEPGTMRSGDLHNCTQMDLILSGRAILRRLDIFSGQELVREYGANDFILIPPRIPHIFEFLEENYMVEWWDCPFEAWYYKPYRDRIQTATRTASKHTKP
ncbi:hypothetical protein WJX74_008934 [Apatococcus lobatus]|uniref:Cupin type-1 domain-containing protein n=1 Tax=Apatococcus lobatus TaxID=904363 RepID=A0AAW1Q5P9_9CHLO